MKLNLTTPGLLFSTISLLLLAYTNRFLALATLIRNLHEKYKSEPNEIIYQQIKTLRQRVKFIRDMQGLGVASLFMCVLCMFLLFAKHYSYANYVFGFSLILLLASLSLSIAEIHVSIKALNIQLGEIEDYNRPNPNGGKIKKAIKNYLKIVVVLTLLLPNLLACKKETKQLKRPRYYTGPVMILDSVKTIYSDSGQQKMQLLADEQAEFQSGDREFKKGIHIDFYNKENLVYAYLQANYAQFNKQSGTYLGQGNVIIENILENKKLETEELRWNPTTKKVYSEAFVKIKTPTEILTGKGLEANQDFSHYRIKELSGVVSLVE